MGAGGDAPPIRAQDVLLLVGLTLLVASIVLRTWDDPVTVDAETPLEGTSSMPDGGTITVSYLVEEATTVTVRLVVDGEEVERSVEPVAGGDASSVTYTMEGRGDLEWSISVFEGKAAVDVDLDRGLLPVVLPPLLGLVFIAYALLLGRADEKGEDHDEDVEAVVDALLLE